MAYDIIKAQDEQVYKALIEEDERQQHSLEMIASENFVSRAVLQAYTSTLTNKYAEGYPGKRYYGGCEPSDHIEDIARNRAKEIFGASYVNVQPHSGAQANMAVFFAAMKPGDTFMGLDLAHGGHLTHGSKVNYSGLYYNAIAYGVDKNTHRIDFDDVAAKAKEFKPQVIVAGASAYARIIDFEKFSEIAKSVGAKLMVDMAHIAGLVAAGLHPSPVPVADYVTSTTHKTLRGPRGGIILTNNEEYEKRLNSRVFPGVQGGPLMHVIAAKAVAFGEALQPDFKEYQSRVIENAAVLADVLLKRGFSLVSGGTDNHLVLLDTFSTKGVTGKLAQESLEAAGITVNKNAIPFDPNPPAVASGVRIGSPALTTRGLGKAEFEIVANLIADVLDAPEDAENLKAVYQKVQEICESFPMDKFRLS